MSTQVWFITGSSSGFGREVAEYVLSQGDKVVATLRKPSALSDLQAQYSSDRLVIVKLDVTKQDEITNAFAKAREAFGRIDVVLNNAGYGILGEVESTSDEAARGIFETNFWGMLNVTREALKFLREVNNPSGGRLINVSSLLGCVAMEPLTGFYAATKFAMEGLTETLAKELDPEWNIKITLLEPGWFHTKMSTNATMLDVHPAYMKPTLLTMASRKHHSTPGLVYPGDTWKAASKIYEFAHSEEASLRLPLGKDCINAQRAKLVELTAGLDKYESWSEDLLRND